MSFHNFNFLTILHFLIVSQHNIYIHIREKMYILIEIYFVTTFRCANFTIFSVKLRLRWLNSKCKTKFENLRLNYILSLSRKFCILNQSIMISMGKIIQTIYFSDRYFFDILMNSLAVTAVLEVYIFL